MSDQKKEKIDDACESLHCAEVTLHNSVAQGHENWQDDDGECDSCLSIEHEMAAEPNKVPKDLLT